MEHSMAERCQVATLCILQPDNASKRSIWSQYPVKALGKQNELSDVKYYANKIQCLLSFGNPTGCVLLIFGLPSESAALISPKALGGSCYAAFRVRLNPPSTIGHVLPSH